MCTWTLLWTMSYLALPLWAALPPPRMGCIPCSDTTNKRKSDVLSYLIDVIACYLTTSANQTLATTSLAGRWHSSVAGVRAITGCQVSMRGGGDFFVIRIAERRREAYWPRSSLWWFNLAEQQLSLPRTAGLLCTSWYPRLLWWGHSTGHFTSAVVEHQGPSLSQEQE